MHPVGRHQEIVSRAQTFDGRPSQHAAGRLEFPQRRAEYEKMNETTKYGLFFLGGVVLGALGAVAVTRGKLDVKPLATDLLSAGIDLKEKALSAVESAKEDIADAVAEAKVKSQEKKARAEEAEAAKLEAKAAEA